MSKPAIKTLIFDLGGVLFTKGTRIAIAKVSKKYNIPEDKVTKVFKGDIGSKYRIAAISKKEFWRKAKVILGKSADIKDISHIWSDSYKPVVPMFMLLRRLKKRGYILLYLSNNVKERADYLDKRYHFSDIFDDGIFSYQAKVKKPDIRLLRLILKKSRCTSEECLFVDDTEENLVPARKIGMNIILFRDAKKLASGLRAKGLHF